MGKKAFTAAVTISLFLISLVGVPDVNVALANPIPWFPNPQMTVTVQSPANGSSYGLPIFVNFTAQGDAQFSVSDNITQQWVRSFFYVLDGQNMQNSALRFAGTKTTEIQGDPVYKYSFSGHAYLTNLSDGPHNIMVYYGAVNSIGYVGTPNENIYYNPKWQATAQFDANSTLTQSPSPSPTVSILSPINGTNFVNISENNTFLGVSFSLNYRTNEVLSWVGYSINGDSNVTIAQNGTIVNLPSQIGNTNLTLYANDTLGDWATPQTTYFFVYPKSAPVTLTPSPTPTQSPSPSPTKQPTVEPSATPNNTKENLTPILIIGSLVAAIVVIALLVYFSKHKGER